MSGLELSAVVFSLASVVLAVRRHPATWPAGIIAVVAYFVVFVRVRLYADATLQIVFLLQGIYGWVYWRRTATAAAAARAPIATLGWAPRFGVITIIALSAWTIGESLARYTDASSPHLDATVSVLSLAANWLLARRVIDNWSLWVTADVIYVALFASKGLVASAALYAIFLVLAIVGWRSWAVTRAAQLGTAAAAPRRAAA